METSANMICFLLISTLLLLWAENGASRKIGIPNCDVLREQMRRSTGERQVSRCRCQISEDSLTARDLLETIAPTYKQTKLPPGFPPLDSINTDKFEYKTGSKVIKVSAKLDEPVTMFNDYVILSGVRMNFTFNKKAPKNSAWKIDVTGSWSIGSTVLHVNVSESGKITAKVDELGLRDIVHEFIRDDSKKDIGIDLSAITLKNARIEADVTRDLQGLNINFIGKLKHNSLKPIPVKIIVNKYENTKLNLYSVLEFHEETPSNIVKRLLNQKTLNVPFFAHMLSDSALFSEEKEVFGLTLSYTEVFHYPEHNIPAEILQGTLQSHIPVGVSLLFPLKVRRNPSNKEADTIKIAFVINKPAFDLLISEEDKISIQQILPVLSKEFESDSLQHIPNFVTNINDAFTTHISFDSSSTIFSIFVRLHDTIELAKKLLKIKLTHLVLQRNVGRDNSKQSWKVAAKGILKIGKSKLHVQYSELSDEPGKPYGLTGFGKELSLEDIISEYDPDFFPDDESEQMIENTEIESIKVHKVRLFSRITKNSNGVPHILLTGFTSLPEWEKDIQMAILLLNTNGTWYVKWAASLKQSPLTNIIQALTGFDSKDLTVLHNRHILTTLISSTLPSYSMLPPHIITTPLLRLPVKKSLSIVALIRFPDNCGDDKLCTAASTILDTSKVFTVKGIISMDGFKLKAKIPESLVLSPSIRGLNSSLQFTIGNTSKMDIVTSINLPRSKMVFDGSIHIYKTGQIQLQMHGRRKHWVAPLGLRSIAFKNLQLVTFYKSATDLNKLQLEGDVTLGSQGNGGEIKAPVKINYDPITVSSTTFYANFSDITLEQLLNAFSIDIKMPSVLEESNFPNGLMLSYSGKKEKSKYQLHGEINIFGRLLNCEVKIKHPGSIKIITENSPAPVIFAKGLIIIQQDMKTKLRGPKIVASINHKKANITVNGYVKILGMQGDIVGIARDGNNIRFFVTGNLMGYKETILTAYSLNTMDDFQVFGCLNDIADQIEELLVDIVSRSANQSIVDMEKADANYIKAQHRYDLANLEEQNIRRQTTKARDFYEEHLLAFGRNEIKVNDTCVAPRCGLKCFGCPKLNKCCRLDIFGHCIACSSWKQCCWKNINPLCIAKHDGCRVVRTVAERDLTEREAQLIQQKIVLDNLDHHLLQSELIKGKHKAILDAAVDAKQIVSEEASPGLNAHDALRGYGEGIPWAKIFDVCYNTSIQQAATGCMELKITAQFFNQPVKEIFLWSCLKDDLITEITESIANHLFPNIIDTNTDGVSDVTTRLDNNADFDNFEDDFAMHQIGGDGVGATSGGVNKKPAVLNEDSETNVTNSNDAGSEGQASNNPSTASKPDSEDSQQPQLTNSTKEENDVQPTLTGTNQQQSSQTNDDESQTKLNQSNDDSESSNPNINQSKGDSESSNPNMNQSNDDSKSSNPNMNQSNDDSGSSQPSKPSSNQSNESSSQPSQPSTATSTDSSQQNLPAAKPSDNNNKKPSKQISAKEDQNLLNTALEEAAEGDDEEETTGTQNQPSNSISPSGEPQVKLIDASRLQDYQYGNSNADNDDSNEDEETDGEDDDEDEGSTKGTSHEQEGINEELKELYEFEVSGSGNDENQKKLKKTKKGRQEKGVLADQLIEQEEIDEEESDKQDKARQEQNRKADQQKSKWKTTNQVTSNDYNSANKTTLKLTYPYTQNNGNVPQAYNYNSMNQNASYNQANAQYATQAGLQSQNNPAPVYTSASVSDNRYPTVNNNNNNSTSETSPTKYTSYSNTGHSYATSSIQYQKALQELDRDQKPLKTKKTKKKKSNRRKSKQKTSKHSRSRRNLDEMIREKIPVAENKAPRASLFTEPFWDIKTDHDSITTRSRIPTGPNRQALMKNVIHKRWRIPDNGNARCHVFHQLIAICKDMAETIVMLDKSLTESNAKFNDENNGIYLELFETEEFLVDAAKRINVTAPLMHEVGKTLTVVRQGVNIWSQRCTNEFDWQNESGVQTWLQAMDIRIQELGGYGVYRFLENLFHAFEALFEALTYADTSAAKDARMMLQRIKKISHSFDEIFRHKLSIRHSRVHAEDILKELGSLRKDTTFC